MTRTGRWLSGVVAAMSLLQSTGESQGYGVYEHGACVMGRAGATVAHPCRDGSSQFFNPAGIAAIRRPTLSGGITLIAPSGGFTHQATLERSELNDRVLPVPTLYFVYPIKQRFSAGIGLFVPYGLETDWPEDSQGRFLGYQSEVRGIYLQPTAAWQVNDWLAVGGGIDFSFVSVQLQQRLDLARQEVPGAGGLTFANFGVPNRTDFGDVDLTGSGTSVGYNIGAQAQALDWLSFGIRFLSRQKITIDDASATIVQVPTGLTVPPGNPLFLPGGTPVDALVGPLFTGTGPLTDQGGSTVLRFPEQLVIGTAVDLSRSLKILVDYQYTNWHVFEVLPLNLEKLGTQVLREDFRASHGLRVGGEYSFSEVTKLRLGGLTHTAAAPPQTVTPNLPEGPRTEFTVGFGTALTRGLRFDAAYQYLYQSDRRGRSTDGGLDVPTTGVNDGLYDFQGHLFGLTFAYTF